MERQSLDCLVLVLGENPWAPNAEYLAGHDHASPGLSVFPLFGEVTVFADACGLQLRRHQWVTSVQQPSNDLGTTLVEHLKGIPLPRRRVGILGTGTPELPRGLSLSHTLHTTLIRELPYLELVSFADELRMLRAVKSEEEIDLLRRSARAVDYAFRRVASEARPGKRDYQVWAAAIAELVRGGSDPSVATRWGSGPRPRLYARPGHGLLQRGSVIAAQFEAGSLGYRTRGIRAIAIHDCDPVLKDLSSILAEYWHACVSSIEVGCPIDDVTARCNLAASRLVPREGRYAQVTLSVAFIGQGLGDDWPSPADGLCDSPASRWKVQNGTVMSIESSLELPTQGRSYRIVWSDPVVVRPTGAQRLGAHAPGLMLCGEPTVAENGE